MVVGLSEARNWKTKFFYFDGADASRSI